MWKFKKLSNIGPKHQRRRWLPLNYPWPNRGGIWYYMQRCSPYDMLMMLYTHIAYVNSRVSPVYLDPRQGSGETITEHH